MWISLSLDASLSLFSSPLLTLRASCPISFPSISPRHTAIVFFFCARVYLELHCSHLFYFQHMSRDLFRNNSPSTVPVYSNTQVVRNTGRLSVFSLSTLPLYSPPSPPLPLPLSLLSLSLLRDVKRCEHSRKASAFSKDCTKPPTLQGISVTFALLQLVVGSSWSAHFITSWFNQSFVFYPQVKTCFRSPRIYFMFGPVITTEAHLAYAGVRIHSNNTTELLSLVEALSFLGPRCPAVHGSHSRIFLKDSKHAPGISLGTVQSRANVLLGLACQRLLLQIQLRLRFTMQHIYSHAQNLGNERADHAAALLYLRFGVKKNGGAAQAAETRAAES